MYWADELAAAVEGPQVVNDSKTPSGTVHVGSLRGPVVLDVISRALRDRDVPTTLLYGVDDMDAMDAQALLTPDAVDARHGRAALARPGPGRRLPASYARHHRRDLLRHLRRPRHPAPTFYWMSEIYPTGRMDPFIRWPWTGRRWCATSTGASAKVERPAGWLPIRSICPTCGRIGTTLAT